MIGHQHTCRPLIRLIAIAMPAIIIAIIVRAYQAMAYDWPTPAGFARRYNGKFVRGDDRIRISVGSTQSAYDFELAGNVAQKQYADAKTNWEHYRSQSRPIAYLRTSRSHGGIYDTNGKIRAEIATLGGSDFGTVYITKFEIATNATCTIDDALDTIADYIDAVANMVVFSD